MAHIGHAQGGDWAEFSGWSAPQFPVPARSPQKPQIHRESIFAVLVYNAQASYYYYCYCPPPIFA